jgi:hypothetical protein
MPHGPPITAALSLEFHLHAELVILTLNPTPRMTIDGLKLTTPHHLQVFYLVIRTKKSHRNMGNVPSLLIEKQTRNNTMQMRPITDTRLLGTPKLRNNLHAKFDLETELLTKVFLHHGISKTSELSQVIPRNTLTHIFTNGKINIPNQRFDLSPSEHILEKEQHVIHLPSRLSQILIYADLGLAAILKTITLMMASTATDERKENLLTVLYDNI